LAITGTSGDDSVSLGGSQITVNGNTIDYSGWISINVNTGAGNDSFTQTATPAVQNHAVVTFNGGTGNDELTMTGGSYTFLGDANVGTSSLTVTVTNGASVEFDASQ